MLFISFFATANATSTDNGIAIKCTDKSNNLYSFFLFKDSQTIWDAQGNYHKAVVTSKVIRWFDQNAKSYYINRYTGVITISPSEIGECEVLKERKF